MQKNKTSFDEYVDLLQENTKVQKKIKQIKDNNMWLLKAY